MAKALYQAPRPTSVGGSSRSPVVVDVSDASIGDEDAILIYRWLDSLEFSRSKKTSPNRDFADGVKMAELVAHYIPKIANTTYYIPTSAFSKKIGNWEHLNRKVFKRIGFQISPELIKELALARPGMIERVLKPIQPILLKGPRAVVPFSKKLENVKPRFMDFEKSYLKKKEEKPQTSEVPVTRVSRRPKSALTQLFPLGKPRERTPSRGKSPLNRSGPTGSEGTNPMLEVITPRRPRSQTRSSPNTRSRTPTERLGIVSGENYDIFSRPSTGRSSNDGPSPTNLATEISNLKEHLEMQAHDKNNNEDSNALLSSSKRGFPATSSWLPVDGEEGDFHQTASSIKSDTDEEGESIVTGRTSEEEADDEIYCDQSGYEEDTEDEGGECTTTDGDIDEDAISVPSSGDTRTRRKLKRVVKYEYREEYILNGMASFQLPNSTDLENVRRDYMSPGNTDPNCRGYGFV